MKNKRLNVLLCCLCLAAVCGVTVLGTLAFLSDRETVKNTFAVGDVNITLDETKVNPDGTPVEGADRVQSNEYHLLPGGIYTKDPTITVEPHSEESFVRMILTVHNAGAVQELITKYELGDFSGLIGGWDPEVWKYQGFTADDAANTISFEFRYKETVQAGDDPVVLPALFEQIIVPGGATGAELTALYEGGFKMVIHGHAIQKAGLETEAAAWEAFDLQSNG